MSAQSKVVIPASAKARRASIAALRSTAPWPPASCQPPQMTRERRQRVDREALARRQIEHLALELEMVAGLRPAEDPPARRRGNLDAEVVELEAVRIFHVAGRPIGVASLVRSIVVILSIRRKRK